MNKEEYKVFKQECLKSQREVTEQLYIDKYRYQANEQSRNICWSQFHKCNCYTSVVKFEYNTWMLIMSYRTIVAVYDYDTEELIIFGKYSTTTSKQLTMIQRELLPDSIRVQLTETNWEMPWL